MTQDLPLKGSWGAPGQVNPSTQLAGDQKTPTFPSIGNTDWGAETKTAPNVLGGSLLNLDPSKFDFFLKTNEDNEELRALDQGHGEQVAYGLGRLVATTFTKALGGFGFIGAAPGAIVNGDINSIVDNQWSQWWQEAEDSVKEAMPIYHANKYNNGNILQQASTLDFWMDDVVDGAAFFTAALLGSKGINLLTKGPKGYLAIAKMFGKMKQASTIGKATGLANAGVKGAALAEEADLFAMSTGNSFVEGMFEAKGVKETLLKQGVSNEEASKAAKGAFWWNMAALMPSNYITNSFLFRKGKAEAGRLIEKIDDKTGQFVTEVKPLTTADKFAAFGKASSKSVVSESNEENTQLAIQNYFQDRALGKNNKDQVPGIIDNWIENFTTNEGQKALFLGALIGLIPGGIGGVKELNAEQANTNQISQLVNTTLEAVRNDPAMKDIWMKSIDPKTKEETYVIDEDGKPVPDVLKLASYFHSLYNTTHNVSSAFIATQTGNDAMIGRLREQVTASLAFGMMFHKDGQVQYNTEIDNMAKNEVIKSTKEGEEVDETEITRRAEEYKRQWKTYQNIYDNIVNNHAGLFTLGNSKVAEFWKQQAIKAQFMGAIDQVYWSKLKKETETKKAEVMASPYADQDIAEGEIKDLDNQLQFIEKFQKNLQGRYKVLMNEKFWQARHDISIKEAEEEEKKVKAEADTKKGAGEKITEEKPAETDIEGKPVVTDEPVVSEEDAAKAREAKKQTLKEEAKKKVWQEKTVEEKQAGVSRAYGDKNLEDASIEQAFSDIELLPGKGIDAFYGGELGRIYIDRLTKTAPHDADVRRLVFRNAETGKEKVITTTNALGDFTLKQLGIVPLKDTLFDIQVSQEMDKLIIQGREYALILDNPLGSIEVNEQGIPVAITLTDAKGEDVTFRNPTLVAELAYAVELMEHVKGVVIDSIQEKGLDSDFVVVTIPVKNKYKETNRQYQVYRDPATGIIQVLKIVQPTGSQKTLKVFFQKVTNRAEKEQVIRTYYSDINKAIEAAYAETITSSFKEIQDETTELKRRQTNAINKAITASRPATAKEIIEAPALSEVPNVKGPQGESQQKPEQVVPDNTKKREEPKASDNQPAPVTGNPIKPEGLTTIKRIEMEVINTRNNDPEYNRLTEEANKAATPLERVSILEQASKREQQIKTEVTNRMKATNKVVTEEKYNAEVASLNKPKEEQKVHPQEEAIVEEVANKIAEERVDEAPPAEVVPSSAGIETADNSFEVIEEDVIKESYEDSSLPKHGIKHSFSAIGYKAEENPEFDKFLSDIENNLEGYYLMADIDYTDPIYWEMHDKEPQSILSSLANRIFDKGKKDTFVSEVDTIPIKLTLFDAQGNKTAYTSLNLHKSGFKNIVVPREIRQIPDATDRREAYEKFQREEMEKTRYVRGKVLESLLSGQKVVFSNIEKGTGVYKTGGENQKLSAIFKDLVNIRIGIADSNGTIYTAGGEMMKGKGSPGGVYIETKETANGQPVTIKLNPAKVSERRAKILLDAYVMAANSQGGWDTIMHHPEVEGLTVGEVINTLVLEGPITNQRNAKYNPTLNVGLLSKTLWMDTSTGILYYGDKGTINLRKKVTDKEASDFVKHISDNKNHVIILDGKFALGKMLNKNFRIGDVEGKVGDTYEQFLIRNGYILTDVVLDRVTGKPFSKPVVMFDASAYEGKEPEYVQQKPVEPAAPAAVKEAALTAIPQKSTATTKKLSKKWLTEGAVISTHTSDAESGSVSTDEIARVVDGKLKVTSTDPDTISEMKDVEGLPITDPEFVKKVNKTSMYTLVISVPVTEEAPAPVVEAAPVNATDRLNILKQKFNPTNERPVRPRDAQDMVMHPEKWFSPEDIEEGVRLAKQVQQSARKIAGEFERAVTNETYHKGNVNKAIAYLKRKFGKNLDTKIHEGIIRAAENTGNVDAFGLFNKDLITLSDALEIGSEYHEAFHRVELLLLSPEQRAVIQAEARKMFNMKDASDRAVSEKLAEAYREYELSDAKPKRKLGEKIKQFFQDLWDFIRTVVTGDLHITELDVNNLFRIISKSNGKLGRLTYAKPNKASAEWLANRSFNRKVKGVEFDTIKTAEQMDSIVKNLIYEVFKAGNIKSARDVDKLNKGFLYVGKEAFQQKADIALEDGYTELAAMFQEVVDKYDNVLDVVADQMLVLGINVSGVDIDDREDPEDESDARGANLQRYNKSHLESNIKDTAASNIKFLVATLRETEELDKTTSLHKFVDFDTAWDSLLDQLHDKGTIAEMEADIAARAESSTMHKDLLKRLKDPRRKDDYDSMRTQFFVTMKKNRNDLVNIGVNKKTGDHVSFIVSNAEAQRISLTYAKAWGQAFASSSIFDKGKPDKAYLKTVKEKFNKALGLAEANKDLEAAKLATIDLFNSISVPMDMATLDNILNTKVDGATEAESLFNFLKDGRKYKVAYVFGDRGPINDIITKGKVEKRGKVSEEIPIQDIFKNESLFKDIVGKAYLEVHSDQRMNSLLGPGGNTYYLISENSFLTDVMDDIRKDKGHMNGINNSTYAQNSLWAKALRDPAVRAAVKISMVSTFAQTESSDLGRGYDELSKLEDYLLKITMLNSGYISLPQLAERTNLYTIKGIPSIDFKYTYDAKTNTLHIPQAIINIFKGYAIDEYNRIEQVKREIADAKGHKELLVEDYHYSTKEGVKGAGLLFQHFPSFNGKEFGKIDLDKEITKMLNDRIEETVVEFTRLGIIQSTLNKNGISSGIQNRLLDENIVKDAIDRSVNKDERLVVKNIIANFVVNGISSTFESEKLFFGDPAYYGTTDNKVKRASVITSTGNNLRLEFGPEVMPGDRLIHSTTFNNLLLRTQKYRSENLFEDLVKKFVAKGQDEAKVRKQLKGYLDVHQTDAQAYISPQMRKALKIKMGEWSEQEDKAYALVMSERELTPKEQSLVDKLYMEPLKFSYFGPSFTPGNARPVMYKTSMATLTYQLTNKTMLAELYDRMQQKSDPVDFITFAGSNSGIKVGITNSVEYLSKNSNGQRIEDEVNVEDLVSTESFQLPFKNLRRQQITDPHMEQYGPLHTQVRKIIMSNILDTSEYKVGEDEKGMSGASLRQENTNIINELSNRGKTEFVNMLGYSEATGTTDKKMMNSFLADRARKANMPETTIEALSSHIDDEFFEHDALPDRKWVGATLIAQMGKHTVDIRLPGTSLIQMSNFGLRHAKKDDSLKLYDSEGYMEAKISVEVFRDSIPGYKDMNETQRMDAANNMFVGVGYRIPTQGLSSTVPLKIVGFLPSTSTDTIALPAEFTTLTGSDFDIDKLYFIRHNYKDGKKVEYLKDVDLKNQSKEAIENRLVDIYLSVLLSNHHLVDTKTPLDASTDALKQYASFIDRLEGVNKTYPDLYAASPVFQSLVKEKYLGGKTGIGPFALSNVHHVLGQQVGLHVSSYLGAGNMVNGNTDLSAVMGQDGIPILTWISALINANVDIAKDPYIFSLNVNQATYNITNLLIRAGVGGELTFSFLTQPILKEFAEVRAMTEGRIKSINARAGNFVKQKYRNLLTAALAAEKKTATDVEPKSEVFDVARLNKDIAQRGTAAYYARQLQVLEKFMELNKVAYALSEAVKSTQIDTKKYGNNLMELKAFNNLVKRVLDNKIIVGMDRMFEETFLKTAYNNTIQLAADMFSDSTILGTPVFSDLHARILGEMGFDKDTSRHALRRINLIADELFAAIAGRFFVTNMGYDTAAVKSMFFGENTMASRVLELKNNPEYANNSFLKLLSPVIGEKDTDPDFISLFNATENRTKWHKDRIIEGWTDLLADPKTHALARDLVAFSYFGSGFSRNLNSFYAYIPPAFLQEIGYVNYIKNIRESLKEWSTGQAIGDELYNDVLKNLWHNSEAVPYLPISDVSHFLPFEGKKLPYWKMLQVESVGRVSKENMWVGKNAAGDPIFRPYFKITTEGETYIYKYVGFRKSTKTGEFVGVYAVDSKRGIKEPAGKVIKEYGLKNSIFEQNNVEKVTDDDLRALAATPVKGTDGKHAYNYEGFQFIPEELRVAHSYNQPMEGVVKEVEVEQVASVPVQAEGQMTFDYEGHQRPDVISKSTIEAILNRERTATTRYTSQGNIAYWSKLKVGDTIKWVGKNGASALVKVTKPLTKLSADTSAEEWSKKEGWSVEYFNKTVKPKLNEAYQIEYELVESYKPTSGVLPYAKYTMHSGGAEGADITWETIGKEYGISEFKHYYHGTKTPHGNSPITDEQFNEGWEHVLEANRTLKRKPEGYKDLLSRNWFQVKNADRVIAVGNIKWTGDFGEVQGGTSWAVQMAIDEMKSVYVFDQTTNQWYEYQYGVGNEQGWIESDIPDLTQNFAGIGTRKLTPNGVNAIRAVYEAAFGGKRIQTPDATQKSLFTDIPIEAVKDNEQDYTHCKI